jgi:hypothetical protein
LGGLGGIKLTKFVGRILSDIKMTVVNKAIRSQRWEYVFTKSITKAEKSWQF